MNMSEFVTRLAHTLHKNPWNFGIESYGDLRYSRADAWDWQQRRTEGQLRCPAVISQQSKHYQQSMFCCNVATIQKKRRTTVTLLIWSYLFMFFFFFYILANGIIPLQSLGGAAAVGFVDSLYTYGAPAVADPPLQAAKIATMVTLNSTRYAFISVSNAKPVWHHFTCYCISNRVSWVHLACWVSRCSFFDQKSLVHSTCRPQRLERTFEPWVCPVPTSIVKTWGMWAHSKPRSLWPTACRLQWWSLKPNSMVMLHQLVASHIRFHQENMPLCPVIWRNHGPPCSSAPACTRPRKCWCPTWAESPFPRRPMDWRWRLWMTRWTENGQQWSLWIEFHWYCILCLSLQIIWFYNVLTCFNTF